MDWLKVTIISIAAIFAPIKVILYIVSLLIISDTITGIIAAYKRGEEINSKGFKKTIIKLFLYNLMIVLAFLLEKYIFESLIPFVKLGSIAIAITEFKSIVENFESTTGINLIKIKKLIEDQQNNSQQNNQHKEEK
ncbi:MAG: phage holin family protein [candidate division WOR-3 bacterium]